MFEIPWTEATMPHFILEVNHRCNITCATCFKHFSGETKGLGEIEAELELVRSKRKIQTVSLAGGEPTLHPDLVAVVRRIHAMGLRTALLTNGVLVDPPLLAALKSAGLDLVMFHIDGHQRRPDLSPGASPAEIDALRTKKVEMTAAAGLDAGLSMILNRDNLNELVPLVEYVIERPEVSYLLVTHALDIGRLLRSAEDGQPLVSIGGLRKKEPPRGPEARTSNDVVQAILKDALGLEPYAFLPSARVGGQRLNRLQWMSYFVPVLYKDGKHERVALESGALDELALRAYGAVAGRFVFYVRPDQSLMLAQVLLNGLSPRRLRKTAEIFLKARRGAKVRAKRLVFDNGHQVTGDGKVVCVEHCPNPTVRNGRIVPVCTADHEAHEARPA